MIATTMVDYRERLAWAMREASVIVPVLAGALGISPQAVRKVLDGSSSAFSAYNNAVAARFLRVNGDWLATGEGDPAPYAEGVAMDVGRRFEALSAAGQKQLLRQLEELEKDA